MADWKKLAKDALLSDGRIDTKETELIRKAIFADEKVDRSELEFLADLRKSAESSVKAFTDLFMGAVKKNLLDDGAISDVEAKWLRKAIFADGQVDADEIQLLKDLKTAAKSVSPEFEKLYAECVK
jgi:hypothetical protein